MSASIVDEVLAEITLRNAKADKNSIPHSDEFIKYLAARIAITPQLVKQLLDVLAASHKIFFIEIVAEDRLRETPRIEGYVVSDITMLRKMKTYFQNELVIMYNDEFHKKMMIHQVIKDIFPIIRSLNNTPIGQIANKSIMLEELEKLMERNFSEYTEEWKNRQLAVEMDKANIHQWKEKEKPKGKSAPKKDESKSSEKDEFGESGDGVVYKRAVDGKTYQEFISKSKSYPVQRILNIYGIKFFLRVYLRKYQFSFLKDLIKDRQIAGRSDLSLMKEMLGAVKRNVDTDTKLKDHIEDIYELERTISHYIYFSDQVDRRYRD
jgi:hypothetical protein